MRPFQSAKAEPTVCEPPQDAEHQYDNFHFPLFYNGRISDDLGQLLTYHPDGIHTSIHDITRVDVEMAYPLITYLSNHFYTKAIIDGIRADLEQADIATYNNNVAYIDSRYTVFASDNLAIASRVDTLSAKVDNNHATIQETLLVQATEDSALATRITNLNAIVDSNQATVNTQLSAYADQNSAQALEITTLAARTDSNTASIVTEQTARTNADTSLSTRIDTLSATVGNNAAYVDDNITVLANEDLALSSRINTLNAKVDNNQATVTSTYLATADLDSALATLAQSTTTTFGDLRADTNITQTTLSNLNGTTAVIRGMATVNGETTGAGFEAIAWGGDGTATRTQLTLHGDNVIIPGTLTGNRIITRTLEATHLKTGTLTAASGVFGNASVQSINIRGFAVHHQAVTTFLANPKSGYYVNNGYRLNDVTKTLSNYLQMGRVYVKRVAGGKTKISGSFLLGGWGTDATINLRVERLRSDNVWVHVGSIVAQCGYRGRATTQAFTIVDSNMDGSKSYGITSTVYRVRIGKYNGTTEFNHDPHFKKMVVEALHFVSNQRG